MATITPVTYKPFGSIGGTTRVGNLLVGTSPNDYGVVGEQNSTTFYATPDENLGYIIAHQDQSGSHMGEPGMVPAYLGFFRSLVKTENSFLDIANYVARNSDTPPGYEFTAGTQANTWLTANGFWSSFVGNTVGPYNLLDAYFDAASGQVTFPNHNLSSGNLNPNLLGNSGYVIYINAFDADGNNNSTILNNLISGGGTLVLQQGALSATFTYSQPNGFQNNYGEYFWDNVYESAQLGTLTLVTPSAGNFNTSTPLYISIS